MSSCFFYLPPIPDRLKNPKTLLMERNLSLQTRTSPELIG